MKDLNLLLHPSAIQSDTWAVELLAHLTQENKAAVEAARQACKRILGHKDAVAHPDWERLVMAALDASRDFEDIAEEVYGERVSFLDDEGWLCQGFSEYNTTGQVAGLLARKVTRKHPQWLELVKALAEKCAKPEHDAPLSDVLFKPCIQARCAGWETLPPLAAKENLLCFFDVMTIPHVLEHERLLSWLEPYKNYLMFVDYLLEPAVIASSRWPEIVSLIKDQPNIRASSEFPRIQQLMKERGLEP
ncbi:hypothetical protein O5O45_12615 [Hahella aquimaris]|uniref:hypothetical protein n=1 Tax=Hahella sp. HNIBRBA332 TaxID=3015983 RepID=UPI00273C28A4|nr:hypothetical protein [Hahella sp. HNIBRBA332]WLQ16761.1 hypothetical protein O5O45_12615 [Hahella sp. HNIBRBA332]